MTLLFVLILPLLTFLFLFFLFSTDYYYNHKNLPNMIMSFCKKITPHSILGLTAAAAPNENLHHYIPYSSLTGGGLLGLVDTATADDVTQRHPLVLESSSLKKKRQSALSSSSSSSSLPPFLPPPATKQGGSGDIGGFGFLDEVGGVVDGFVSCTESLGFESSDEIMRADDHHQVAEVDEDEVSLMRKYEKKRSKRTSARMRDKRSVDKANNKSTFPPPISSLNKNGRPNSYLRPVRRDGRLELTEVKIHRPEILRAHREHGRLRLHLISHDQDLQDLIDEEEGEQEEEEVEEINNVVMEENVGIEITSSVNEGDQWKIGGEGFRRCQDHHHHHHNNHHVWAQQHCVV